MTVIGWWWHWQRARHHRWKVWVDWYNTPNEQTFAVWQRARHHVEQVKTGRP